MSTVQATTVESFERDVVRSDVPVVVDFYATWCPPCRALAPVLDQLAAEMSGQVRFVKVNIDEHGPLADRYRIQAVPTLLFFHGGQVVDQLSGLQSADTLRRRLAKVTQTSSSPVR